jgi:hypothetical protein
VSSFEQIFIDPDGLTLEQAGQALASALGLRTTTVRGVVALSGTATEAALPADVRGTVEPNIYAEPGATTPEERSIFDDLPVVLELQTAAKEDFEHQGDVARALYARMVEKLAWRSVLTSEYSHLIAAFDRQRGLRTFPRGTLSEGTHEHIWG